MIAPLLLLLLLVAAIIVIRASTVRRNRAARSADPRCGRCGYIVRGISTLTCPECGSDLREVGIRTAGSAGSPWIPMIGLGLVWSIVVFAMTAVLTSAMHQVMPRWITATHVSSLAKPYSGAYRSVRINATDEYRVGADPIAAPYEPKVVTELSLNDGTMASLTADLEAGTYAYRTPDGQEVKRTGPIDGRAIIAWMNDLAIDTTSPEALAEATQIAERMRAQPSNRRSHGYSSGSSRSPDGAFGSGEKKWTGHLSGVEWATVAPPALGLIAWVVGIWWIARRYGPHARDAHRGRSR